MEKTFNENKKAKREEVEQIKDIIQKSNSFVVMDYKGLNVAEDTEFRNTFRKADVEYKVLKNTLLRLALNELGYKEFDEFLVGPTAVAFSHADALEPAKLAATSIKKYNKMQIKCGMFDKKFIDQQTAVALSKVPNREVLLAMLLSVLQAPVRGLAIAVKAIAEKNA